MAEKTDSAVFTAGNRFGLGLRPGEASIFADDPRGWLREQLDAITRLPLSFAALEDSATLLSRAGQTLRDTRMSLQEAASRRSGQSLAPQDARELRRNVAGLITDGRREQAEQLTMRLNAALQSETPFTERLVRFWSNHFTVATGGGIKRLLGLAGSAYENEAIRARLGGSFSDLLLAVEQHPAMLIYLDNTTSIGPNSRLGNRRDRGLNENLAREILELHTLGVNGGYTQQDVTSLARLITGWTVGGQLRIPQLDAGEAGAFLFVAAMHEPGRHTLLGETYREDGVEQGEQALRDLARHPATARHIATRLAVHFIADEPPGSAVAKLERVFLDTEGDLPSLHDALIDLEEAWADGSRKLKTPEDLLVSTGRALGVSDVATLGERPQANPFLQAYTLFGQAPFTAPSPAGWPDSAAFWGNADALIKRIEWSQALVQALPDTPDARSLYPQILQEDELLAQEIERAESATQALALLVASPRFQWR